MKKFFCLILAAFVLLSLVSCGSDVSDEYAQSVFNAKTSSVENDKQINALAVALDLYNLTAYGNISSGEENGRNYIAVDFAESVTDKETMDKNIKSCAAILLGLVKDADIVYWRYFTGNTDITGSLNKNEATELLGYDVKNIYRSADELKSAMRKLGITDIDDNEIKVNHKVDVASKS